MPNIGKCDDFDLGKREKLTMNTSIMMTEIKYCHSFRNIKSKMKFTS